MGEVVNALVAFAVIVFIVRWATTNNNPNASPTPSSILGFRPKNVTPEMVDTVHNMFPDIPSDNIRFDLLRTGNVQFTSDKILERGFLPAPPPAYYTLYPRPATDSNPAPAPTPANNAATGVHTKLMTNGNLISRYGLQERIADSASASTCIVSTPEEAGGKAVWETSAEKREASLRERKAQMILAARQRLLEREVATAGSSKDV